jgi:16S rRNA processing protein RimM
MNKCNAVSPDWVIVGRFGRPHGIKGFIRVLSFTDPHENLLSFPTWYIQQNQTWTPVLRLNTELSHKTIVTQIKGFVEREDVSALTNCDIAIPGTELPVLEPDEYYWHELEGMHVVHKDGHPLGVVRELMMTGSNDVLVVEGERRHLIPYLLDDVVLQVDRIKRIITVNWDVDF